MNEEERQSQVSALFDGALEDSQCDLVVRRIMKDPQLAKSWSRYALIGATLRGDPLSVQARGHDDVAARVRAALEDEAPLAATAVAGPARSPGWTSSAHKALWGTALAASVAAASILVLRLQGDAAPGALVAQTAPSPAPVAAPAASAADQSALASAAAAREAPAGPAPSYVTPVSSSGPGMSAPLVNYVVAHSEYLTPVMRFNPLSAVMMGSFEPGDELVEATEAEIGAARR